MHVAADAAGFRRLQRIEPGSVFKFSALFSLTFGLVLLLAGGIVFLVLKVTGFVDSVQSTIQNVGFTHFRLQSLRLFEILAAVVLVGAVAWTALSVLAAVVFNLVDEAVGGIKLTMKD